MKELLKEYQELVQDVRHLLEKDLPKEKIVKTKASLPLPLAASSKIIVEKKEEEKEKTEILPEPELPPPSVEKSKISPVKIFTCGSFTLEKSSPITPIDLTSIKATLQKVLPPQALFLYLYEEALPFLNKVAAALTKYGVHSNTYFLDIQKESAIKDFFATTSATLFISEYDPIFTKLFSLPERAEPHKYFSFSTKKSILFLHPVHSYETNIAQKHNLWNSLKTLLPQ